MHMHTHRYVAVVDSVGNWVYRLPADKANEIWPGIGRKTIEAKLQVCVCVCVCCFPSLAHIHTHTHIHTYIHTYTHTHTHLHTYIHIHTQ